MSRRVDGPDGQRWSVGRRILPWRPRRMRRWTPWLEFLDFGDLDALGLVILALVLLPVVIVLALFAVEWLAVLALAPVVVAVRELTGRPWTVVARPVRAGFGAPAPVPVVYTRRIPRWRAAGRLAEQVKREIKETGEPRSLGDALPAQRQPTRAGRQAVRASARQWMPAGSDTDSR